MDHPTLDALSKWKEHRYRPVEIPFVDAVRSLGTTDELVEARQSLTRKSDWVLCRPGTSAPAIFVYAGVFSEADPYDTGNLVWGKASVPDCLDEGRVARYAGFKAAYSYAIETYNDKEIWQLQADLDGYMQTVPGFNTRGVPRREWQNGSTWHLRYWFKTPMFLTCEARGGRPEPPDGLHEWVAAAHRKSKTYRANPTRPRVCGLKDGRLELISNCVPDKLEYGDVVSLVFGITYVEDREDWGPVPMLSHIVRVQHANREVYQLTSSLATAEPDDEAGDFPLGSVVDVEQDEVVEAVVDANVDAPILLTGVEQYATSTGAGDTGTDDISDEDDVAGDRPGGEFLLDDIAEESGTELGADEYREDDAPSGVAYESTSEMDVDDEGSMLSYVVLDGSLTDIDAMEDAMSNASTLTEGSATGSFGTVPGIVSGNTPMEQDAGGGSSSDETHFSASSERRIKRGRAKNRRGGRHVK